MRQAQEMCKNLSLCLLCTLLQGLLKLVQLEELTRWCLGGSGPCELYAGSHQGSTEPVLDDLPGLLHHRAHNLTGRFDLLH